MSADSGVFYADPIPYAALGASFDRALAAEAGEKTAALLFCADVTRNPSERVALSEDGLAASLLTRAYLSHRERTIAYTVYDNACIDARAAREVFFRAMYEPFTGILPPYSLNGKRFDGPLFDELTKGKRVYRNPYDGEGERVPACPQTVYDGDFGYRLSAAATVLLKNEGALPAEKVVYIGTAPAALPDYLQLKREHFSPRAVFRAGRKLARAGTAVLVLDYDDGFTRAQTEMVKFAAARVKTVVVMAGEKAVHIPFADQAAALVYAPAGVAALPALVSGALSPCGRLPFTWAGQNLYPAANPKGLRHDFFYESVYNGYRWFSAAGIRPAFPFGTGKSYLDVKYTGLKLTADEDALLVKFTLANRSPRAGNEIPLVFVGLDDDRAYGLKIRLAGFQKVALRAEETKSVTITVPLSELAVYDEGGSVLPGGKYGVTVTGSAGEALYGAVKLGGKCKPRFTAAAVPSYYPSPKGFNILGVDAERVIGVSLYPETAYAPDLKPYAKKYPPDVLRRLSGLTKEQVDRL